MPRRSGVTLLEVLVAIFVMGIGMLALLTLFPLGALRMAKAIQDQRCADAGAAGQSMSIIKNIRNDPGLFTFPQAPDPFKNPSPGSLPDAFGDGPSYPVFIDPVGWMNSFGLVNPTPPFPLGSGFQPMVGNISAVPRRTVNFVQGAGNVQQQRAAYYQWFTVLDDIDFENALPGAGTNSAAGSPRLLLPVPPNNAVFTRDIRYSYAFLCQRPRYADATVVDTQIVVFNKRVTAGLGAPGNQSLPEYVYSNTKYNNVSNTITIDYSAGGVPPPPVRAGDWILDATPVAVPVPPTIQGNFGSAHGYFYRIVGVNDQGNSVLEFEVETPLRGFPPNTNNNAGVAIVIDGIAEVFTKGTSRLP